MKRNSCSNIQASFSAYLDGRINGQQMQAVSRHLEGAADAAGSTAAGCAVCATEFAAWRSTQAAVSALGPAKAPKDLALRLRLAISHECARRNSRLLDRIWLAWDNAVRPMLVQVSAGVAGSVAMVGGIALLLGMVAAPSQAVLADDESLGAITPPHYKYSIVSPGAIVAGHDTAIVVEASVDDTGRVYDYSIVSGPEDEAVRLQIADQLLGYVFQPASVFGVPVRGRAVVTFAGISVRG
jgi:anti-sigma factor RsiW